MAILDQTHQHQHQHQQEHEQEPARASNKASGEQPTPAFHIDLVRLTSRLDDRITSGIEHRCYSWRAASDHLQAICEEMKPGRLSHDACEFRVTFSNGYVYSGTFEARHPSNAAHTPCDLGAFIEQAEALKARTARPAHIAAAYWEWLIDTQPAAERERAASFLTTYSLRD